MIVITVNSEQKLNSLSNQINKIKIIPNTQSLTMAKAAVKKANLNVDNALLDLNRNKGLFDKGIIPKMEYDAFVNLDKYVHSPNFFYEAKPIEHSIEVLEKLFLIRNL